MRARLGLLMAGMAIGAAVGTAAAGAWATPDLASDETVRVRAKTIGFHFSDEDPEGNSVGDSFVQHLSLSRDGRKVGYGSGSCTFAYRHPLRSACSFSYKLPGGQVTAQAVVTFQLNKAQTFDFAVTGGTGNYRNARGSVELEQIKGGLTDITFHLQP